VVTQKSKRVNLFDRVSFCAAMPDHVGIDVDPETGDERLA
jgi:hypothetical protein